MKSLEGWIPIRIYWEHDLPMVDWGYLGELPLTDPFFEQTVNRALSHPANLLFRHQTPIDALREQAAARPGVPPAGFIFHMSRCGSTLISQMLAALPHFLVISEASPIDTILRSQRVKQAISDEQRVRWLQWLVSALGQARRPEHKHLFIKFDCWHTLFLPLIRRAFPGVPWVFVYRQPLEVLMSQHAQRGAQMIPGVLEPGLFGWTADEVGGVDLEEYGARVLGKICSAALDQVASGDGKLLNYHQLPEVVWTSLLHSWRVECSHGDTERMREAARFNAKNPVWLFEPDSAARHQAATQEIRELAGKCLDPVFLRLEDQRRRVGFA